MNHLHKHLLAMVIDANAPPDIMRRAEAFLDKWQPIIEAEAIAAYLASPEAEKALREQTGWYLNGDMARAILAAWREAV